MSICNPFLWPPLCLSCVPLHQMFVSSLHYYVVKEYVSQLMKNNYSCKNRKHDKAATKMRVQWNELNDLFEEMVTLLNPEL